MPFYYTTKENWLESCLLPYRPFYYRRYFDDIFVLFSFPEHLKPFQSNLNSRHGNRSFTIENEKDNRVFFLDVNIIREQGKFTTSVYYKQTFSGIFTYFYSFLPSTYKIDIIHTLLFRCFQICSDWTKFHLELVKLCRCFWIFSDQSKFYLELVKLMDVFQSNSYPGNFINNLFKEFLDHKHRRQEKVTKKPLFWVFPYLGPLSPQTRTNLRKHL